MGVHDSGNFKIGDSFSEGEEIIFKGIPSFSPEHFRYINNLDPMKSKQLAKGIDQLMDEGVAQLFVLEMNGRKIIGTVGALQFEVIQYRLEHEYGAKCSYENLNIFKACWVETDSNKNIEFIYELSADDFMINFRIKSEGLSPVLSNDQKNKFSWNLKAFRNSRSIEYENWYTELTYGYESEKMSYLSSSSSDEDDIEKLINKAKPAQIIPVTKDKLNVLNEVDINF